MGNLYPFDLQVIDLSVASDREPVSHDAWLSITHLTGSLLLATQANRRLDEAKVNKTPRADYIHL